MSPALLDEVLEAHGGLERWRAAREIRARVRSGGFLVRTRMPGSRFADYHLTVSVTQPRVIMDPFPEAGMRGIFHSGAVRIEASDGEVVSARPDPRPAFFGRSGVRRNLRWDPLDSVYFAGYAMWNYLTTPLLLTRQGVALSEGGEWREGAERWRRIDAEFDGSLDTHSRRQTFYFDARGLLRRHDYVAEVVGGWARAVHLCADHTEADGLVFPTRRRVRPTGPRHRPMPFPTLVWLEISDLRVAGE